MLHFKIRTIREKINAEQLHRRSPFVNSDMIRKKVAASFTVGIRLNAITIFAFRPIAPFYGFLRSWRQLKWRSLRDVFTGHSAANSSYFRRGEYIDNVTFAANNSALTTMCRKHFIIQNFTAGVT